jgi:CRISPR type III-A/MTUBE-associated protein Csm6
MSKTVLFSPIGTTDPMSSSNYQDGSMLHICRVYQPDDVHLYYSKDMWDNEERDGRSAYCLELLGKKLGHNFNVKKIKEDEEKAVNDYNWYVISFLKHITQIRSCMDKEDVLLVNTSSGTPQMKSALMVLATMADYRIKPILVSTPEKGANEHRGKKDRDDYDVEAMWEVNTDNNDGFENRCSEPTCPNLTLLLKKNILGKHIEAYDYSAALDVAKEIKEELPEDGMTLLEVALDRTQLNFSSVNAKCTSIQEDILPVKSSKDVILFEYALEMGIKLEHEKYADFIRAISPILTDLFWRVLDKQCGINVDSYVKKVNKIPKWYGEALKKDDIGKRIYKYFEEECTTRGGFRDGTSVAASNLTWILKRELKDQRLLDMIERLRDIEYHVRNMAAHEIVSITEDNLSDYVEIKGITFKKILDDIHALVVAAGIKIKSEDWKSYDVLNKRLIDKLELEIK